MSVESEMKAWGKATYRKFQQYYRQNERGSETASSKRILDRMAPKLAQPVEDFFNRFVQDGSPSMPIWLTFICDLHPQVVAHLGLKAMLNYVVSCNNFNRLAFMIGREYESICRRQVAEETVSKNQMYDVKLQRDRNQRIRKFYNVTKNHKRFEHWQKRHKIALGAWLLGEIRRHTGLIEIRTERIGKRQRRVVHLTAEFSDWVRRFDAWREVADPIRMALPHRPREWVDYNTGGYESFKDTFVNNRPNGDDYKFFGMQRMYTSVNNVQRVAWQINTQVLEVAQRLWDNGRLPNYAEVPLQPYLENGHERPEELRAWKFKQDKIRRINEANRSKRLVHIKLLHLAKKYSQWDKIHFPCSIDYRGRLYYMPSHLHPQGNDLSRALLLFKRGEQIMDDNDLERLLVHGANCWGLKGSVDERIEWVRKHEGWILETAEDPYTNEWWTDASEPFGFLAFCFEYQRFTKEGYGYVSHFPVRMDCTNNGMQILHLLLRDKELAHHCNLVPDQPPGDMYQYVADLVYERLKQESKENYIASQWFKHGVSRKLAKLAIMNKPYGQSYFHVLQGFLYAIGDNHPFEEGEQIDAINYLAKQFNDIAREVLVSLGRVHQFLRGCAHAIGNKEMKWTTPIGFKVIQNMTKTKLVRVQSVVEDVKLELSYNIDLDEVDPRQQKKCITANFIHGLDASVVHRVAHSMTFDMGFVHDCFISHASNARKVHQNVRETYKEFFGSIDLLKEFRCELQNHHPTVELPELPELGDLDVTAIDRAMYLLS